MSRSASTAFQPRHIPEARADRRALGVDARFTERIRAATDGIGRGTWDGTERRSTERRSAA